MVAKKVKFPSASSMPKKKQKKPKEKKKKGDVRMLGYMSQRSGGY